VFSQNAAPALPPSCAKAGLPPVLVSVPSAETGQTRLRGGVGRFTHRCEGCRRVNGRHQSRTSPCYWHKDSGIRLDLQPPAPLPEGILTDRTTGFARWGPDSRHLKSGFASPTHTHNGCEVESKVVLSLSSLK